MAMYVKLQQPTSQAKPSERTTHSNFFIAFLLDELPCARARSRSIHSYAICIVHLELVVTRHAVPVNGNYTKKTRRTIHFPIRLVLVHFKYTLCVCVCVFVCSRVGLSTSCFSRRIAFHRSFRKSWLVLFYCCRLPFVLLVLVFVHCKLQATARLFTTEPKTHTHRMIVACLLSHQQVISFAHSEFVEKKNKHFFPDFGYLL